MPNLFDKGIIIIDKSEEDLVKVLRKSESALFDQIVKLYETVNITDGKLANSVKAEEFLAALDRRILASLKSTGYNDGIKQFLISFDDISTNVKEIQSSLNNINITNAQINPIKQIEVQSTLDGLIGNKFQANVIQPIRQSLYRNILFGSTIAESEKFLKDYIISNPDTDSKMMRYVKQISRDSISQFDGSIQQAIQGDLNLNAMRYVGSLLLDSRSQCKKWTEDGLIRLDTSFALEIQEAIDKKLFFDGKYSSGMIADTNIRTILINRGGYNCRHRAIPTKYFIK